MITLVLLFHYSSVQWPQPSGDCGGSSRCSASYSHFCCLFCHLIPSVQKASDEKW